MEITSISEPGPSTRPDFVPFPAPPAAPEVTEDVDVTRRSRSPPPSPHLPNQHLPTPGPAVASAARTNGKRGRSKSPSLLEVPEAPSEERETQLQAVKSPSLCSSCAPNARQETKYTCPRCGTKTCSVGCSRTHKEVSGCSGERNKAAYVPMKEYGWGSMMNDYTFLEDIGRKVGEVGREIVRGGYSHPTSLSHPSGHPSRGGSARGRGRGAGLKRGRGAGGKTKRDVWKMQMEVRDVDVDLLPLGMKRRKANQSSWDFKNQAALLTIELKFYPSSNPSSGNSPLSSPKPQTSQPLTILTHRTSSSHSLSHIIHSLVLDRSKKEGLKGKPTDSEASSSCPEWLKTMVLVPSAAKAKLKMAMRAPVDPVLILNELKREVEESKGEREYKSGLGKLLAHRLAAYARPTPSTTNTAAQALKRKHTPYPPGFKFPKVYYALDSEKALLDALRHTTFVEYPTIEVYEEGDERLGGCLFVQPGKLGVQGGVVRGGPLGAVAEVAARPLGNGIQPQKKRRKLDPKEAKEKIKGLIGDYGSDSEGDEVGGEDDRSKKGVGSLLGEYAASDEDEEPGLVLDEDTTMAATIDDGLHDDDAEGEDDPDHVEPDPNLDEEDEELDPAALLELVRQVKGEQWVKEQERMAEDVLDWEGSDADLDAEGEVDEEEEEV
ncbi:hypothetical protein BKA70DRAFT_1420370 [Coprinopsis sp. MPI-PUGE-AT-0042]|nr:hypothetical protein BKA70DRAFT_1420370 [Coprinopsis sp. MPI-PUGE-AT-0042]